MMATVDAQVQGNPKETSLPTDTTAQVSTPILGGIVAVLLSAIAVVLILILLVWRMKFRSRSFHDSCSEIDSRPKLPAPARTTVDTEDRPNSYRHSHLETYSEGIYDEVPRCGETVRNFPPQCHVLYSGACPREQGTLDTSAEQSGYFYSNPTYSSPSYSNNMWSGFYLDDPSDFVYCDPVNDTKGFLYSCTSIYDDSLPLMPQERPLEVMPENIVKVSDLGVGNFGDVMLARTVGLSLVDLRLSETDRDPNVSVRVAIKTLKPNIGLREAFDREIKFMSRLNHENIIRLLGVCSRDPEHSFIVMEYMENGDLSQYLQQSDISSIEEPHPSNTITTRTLLFFALQIANGMKYLASMNFIHRDLATRNCLMGSGNTVKVADFGLSRSLYSSCYYMVSGRAVLPIRWMATECFYGKFSEKTDIWALGMTMWEIFTGAKEQPLAEMTSQEVIADAIRGPERRLPTRPEHCPEEVFGIVQKCWEYEPGERATFKEVHSSLTELYAKLEGLP